MSPLPVSTNSLIADSQMDFPSAMKAVIAGNKVSKLEWNNSNIVVWLEDKLKIKLADGSIHDLLVSSGDMYGDDWFIV